MSSTLFQIFPRKFKFWAETKQKKTFVLSPCQKQILKDSLSLQLNSKAVSMNHSEKKWLRVSKSLKSLNMLAGESVCCELRSWAYRAFKDKFSEEEFFLSNYQNDETDPKNEAIFELTNSSFVQWSSLEDEQD